MAAKPSQPTYYIRKGMEIKALTTDTAHKFVHLFTDIVHPKTLAHDLRTLKPS